jgi:rod shape-determining protein MreC
MSSSSLAGRGSRRRSITFLVLVIISVLLLAVSESGPVSELRRGINFAVGPVRDSLSDGTRSATGFLDALAEVDLLKRENLALQGRVDVLEDEAAGLESMRARNAQLEKVLKTREALSHKTVVAEVVAAPASRFESVISIDRGSEVGIKVGNPVLSEGGALAGAVIDVGEGRSDVQLINDTRSLVTGRDKRTGATGDVVGRLSAPLAMEEIRVTDKVAVGDLVVTAGLDLGKRFKSQFPNGLVIGTVISIEQERGLVVQTALVEPAANLDRLEIVLVITDFKGPVRKGQDTAAES